MHSARRRLLRFRRTRARAVDSRKWAAKAEAWPARSVPPFKTNQLVCNGEPNAYFRVKDMTSGLWSQRVPVRIGCVVI